MPFFNDQLRHEIPLAADYPFAAEGYPAADARHALTQAFMQAVEHETGVSPFNCKISQPSGRNDIYNVYLYFWDINEVFTPDEQKQLRINGTYKGQKAFFTNLFLDTLERFPVDQMERLRINPNGVFAEDFRVRVAAHCAKHAEKELTQTWRTWFPQIKTNIRMDNMFYLFFADEQALNHFAEHRTAVFCWHANRIMQRYDEFGALRKGGAEFVLDVQSNYDRIGGQFYFNSNAMSGLRRL